MLSPRTQLAVWCYAACNPVKILKTPQIPTPSYTVNDMTSDTPLHFVETDPKTFEVPLAPYAKTGRVINWFFVAPKNARKHYIAILDADANDLAVPAALAAEAHARLMLPVNKPLAAWVGGPDTPRVHSVRGAWRLHKVPHRLKYRAVRRASLMVNGPPPSILL